MRIRGSEDTNDNSLQLKNPFHQSQTYIFNNFQGRKRQFEYKKLESIHMKQQAVLKRKTEEVSDTF